MTSAIVGPTHYRIRESLFEDGLQIQAEKFFPIKETPHGFWVLSQHQPQWLSVEEVLKRKYAKWVSKNSIKRYCYPSLEDALKSYRRRKKCQQNRLSFQLERITLALEKFAEYKDILLNDPNTSVNIGEIPSQYKLNWDL